MANQKKRISGEYSWRGEPTYSAYLPDDIKTVITVFFVISTIFGITMFFVLKKKQNKKYWWLIVLSVFNYLLGLFMVMIK